MLRGFRWLGLAGVIAVAALVGPSAALACDGSGSAVSIYTQCTPKASGGHHARPPAKHPGSQPATTYYPQPVVHVTPRAKQAIAHSGKDKKVLKNIVSNPNLVDSKRLKQPVLASAPARESSLGSAVNLGTGPTVFFALLLGTVLVALGAGGVRAWRNRHRI
jgi:hypothetical protein